MVRYLRIKEVVRKYLGGQTGVDDFEYERLEVTISGADDEADGSGEAAADVGPLVL